MRAPAWLVDEAKRAAPYAIVLALLLGAIVVVGAHQSNASPSEKRPFGWDGPAGFENAVAMVRTDLVIAASLPALLLGARALAGREPRAWQGGALMRTWAVHAGLLVAGVALAGLIGAIGASRVPEDSALAFIVAHSVLALSFYSLAFLWSSLLREHALAAAAATWLAFVGIYDRVLQTVLFRTEGYHNLVSGAFPNWFWVSQAFSPLSSYRGILILWREGFRDYVEKFALAEAVLPAWLVPATFIALAIALWMALPLALAHLSWWWRARSEPVQAKRVPERAG